MNQPLLCFLRLIENEEQRSFPSLLFHHPQNSFMEEYSDEIYIKGPMNALCEHNASSLITEGIKALDKPERCTTHRRTSAHP
jgi:hypothetical protein